MATIVNFDNIGQITGVARLPWQDVPAAVDANFAVQGRQIAAVAAAVDANTEELNTLRARVDEHDRRFAGIAAAATGNGGGFTAPQPQPAPAQAAQPQQVFAPAAPVRPAAPAAPVAPQGATVIVPDVQNHVNVAAGRNRGFDTAPLVGAGIAFAVALVACLIWGLVIHGFTWWMVLVAVIITGIGFLIGLAVSCNSRDADEHNDDDARLVPGFAPQVV